MSTLEAGTPCAIKIPYELRAVQYRRRMSLAVV